MRCFISTPEEKGYDRSDFADRVTNTKANGFCGLWLDDAGVLHGRGNGISGDNHTRRRHKATFTSGASPVLTELDAGAGITGTALRGVIVVPGTAQQTILYAYAEQFGSSSAENGVLRRSTNGGSSTSVIYNPHSGGNFYTKGCSNTWTLSCSADGSLIVLGTYGYIDSGGNTDRDVWYSTDAGATWASCFHIEGDGSNDSKSTHIHMAQIDPDGGIWVSVGDSGSYVGLWHCPAVSLVTVADGATSMGGFTQVYSGGNVRPIRILFGTGDSGEKYAFLGEDVTASKTITRIRYDDASYTPTTMLDLSGTVYNGPITMAAQYDANTYMFIAAYESTGDVPAMILSTDGGKTFYLAQTIRGSQFYNSSYGLPQTAVGSYPVAGDGWIWGSTLPGGTYYPPFRVRPPRS